MVIRGLDDKEYWQMNVLNLVREQWFKIFVCCLAPGPLQQAAKHKHNHTIGKFGNSPLTLWYYDRHRFYTAEDWFMLFVLLAIT